MLEVVSYQSGKMQYACVKTTKFTDYLQFKDFYLERVQKLPTLLDWTIIEYKLSLSAKSGSDGSIKARIINYYLQRANAFSVIWKKLGGSPPENPEDILTQFSEWLIKQKHRKEIDVSNCSLYWTGVEFLFQFEALESLIMHGCSLKQTQLDYLIGDVDSPRFKHLKHLNVSKNESIISIPYHPELTDLIMNNTGVTNVTGVKDVEGCSEAYKTHSHKLKMLDLRNTHLPEYLDLTRTVYDKEAFEGEIPWEWVYWMKLDTIETMKGFEVT